MSDDTRDNDITANHVPPPDPVAAIRTAGSLLSTGQFVNGAPLFKVCGCRGFQCRCHDKAYYTAGAMLNLARVFLDGADPADVVRAAQNSAER